VHLFFTARAVSLRSRATALRPEGHASHFQQTLEEPPFRLRGSKISRGHDLLITALV